MNLVKLPKMSKSEIDKLIQDQMICRIAFKGEKYPYMAPFQYVLIDEVLYFHFTDYGKKMQLLDKDNHVCVEIEQYTPNLSNYRFLVFSGKLIEVTDPEERMKVINKMAEEGKEKLSDNFLVAHGLHKENGWSSFTPKKSMVILKLKKIKRKTALKSP